MLTGADIAAASTGVPDVGDAAGTGGAMIAPISVSAARLRKCPRCNGVSRTISTSRRRSLRITSAARVSSEVVTPEAISATLRTEHGATIMPRVLNEPEESEAAMSPILWQRWASALTCATLRSVS